MNECSFILSIMPELLQGAITSVLVAMAAISLGVVLGISVCQMRRSQFWGFKRAAGLYISFMRGIPVLVVLFLGVLIVKLKSALLPLGFLYLASGPIVTVIRARRRRQAASAEAAAGPPAPGRDSDHSGGGRP